MVKKLFGFILVLALIWIGMGGAAPPPGPPPIPPPAPAPAPQTTYQGNLPGYFDPYYGYHYSGRVVDVDSQNGNFLYDIGGATVRVQTDSKTLFYRLEERHGTREYFDAEKFFNHLAPGQLIWLQGEDTEKRIFSLQTPTNFFYQKPR